MLPIDIYLLSRKDVSIPFFDKRSIVPKCRSIIFVCSFIMSFVKVNGCLCQIRSIRTYASSSETNSMDNGQRAN